MLFIKLLSLSFKNRAIYTHELWKWRSHLIHLNQPNDYPWKQTTKLFIPQVIIMPSFMHRCWDPLHQVAIIEFGKQGHTYAWTLKMEVTSHPFKPIQWISLKIQNWALYTTSNNHAECQAQVWRCYLSICYHWVSKTRPYIHMKFENGVHVSSIQANFLISLANRELSSLYHK